MPAIHHHTDWDLPDPSHQGEFYEGVAMKRFVAFVLDSIAILAISILIVPFTAFTALFFFGLLAFVVGLLYRTATIRATSATPGMWIMGIELRNMHGERLDTPLAFAHSLLFSIMASMILPQLLSAALMLSTSRGQGLHDLVLGTTALNRAARN